MGDLLRAPEWYHFSTKNSNAVWTKSKSNPNFQLVNKPSLGSITLVKKKKSFLGSYGLRLEPLFVTARVRAFKLS